MSAPLTIVKVGTGVLTNDDGTLDGSSIVRLVTHLSALKQSGISVVLVSSGAVGAGVPILGLTSYPKDIATRQAAAAVGQTRLMKNYEEVFSKFGLNTAQVLVSTNDLKEEKHRQRLKTVLEKILKMPHLIPIVNENDVVSLRELTQTDNDMLAAKLAGLIEAENLILLTSVDGLYHPDTKEVIREVSDVQEVMKFVINKSGKFSIGGMDSKLQAVEVALASGTKTIIANGEKPERLPHLLTGEAIGTYFK